MEKLSNYQQKWDFPKSGVCSAKFWIIAFNDAIDIINTHGAVGNGFADDCVTMVLSLIHI